MKYYPIHTHLHCAHEATASIGSHMSYAKALGIQHLWTTEHDTRISKPKGEYLRFFFPQPELFTRLPSGRQAGFQEVEENTGTHCFAETDRGIELHLLTEPGQRESLFFHTQGKAHSDPLFSRLMVEMDADVALEGGRVLVEFILSTQPPTHQQARLCYVMGEMPEQKAEELVQYVPFPEKTEGKYRFCLFEDVSEAIGGVDNALCNLNLIGENGAKITFREFRFSRELEYEKTRQAQIALTKKLTEKWGVTAFVGFEVTGAGNHKNCYSTKVPVMERGTLTQSMTEEQAIAYLQSYNAVFSWNHPLTEFRNTGKTMECFFEDIAEELVKNRVYGASMIEVGFPYGRGQVAEREYLRLWDRLSENGILITGNGDSDNHHGLPNGWTEGNNFCVFAGLLEEEMPTAENFAKAFRRGSVWSGNPVVIRNLSFTGDGKAQGSLLRGRQAQIALKAWDIQCGGYAVCVINGKEAGRVEIQDGAVEGAWTLTWEQPYNFARVELYNEENVLIAFSNPIYLVDENTQIKER